MVKKKYDFFESGDLIKFKRSLESFQRGPNGTKISRRTSIEWGNKVIYLGAKVCPTSTKHWREDQEQKSNFIYVRYVTIKVMHEGAVWYVSCPKDEVYHNLKLVQKVHK